METSATVTTVNFPGCTEENGCMPRPYHAIPKKKMNKSEWRLGCSIGFNSTERANYYYALETFQKFALEYFHVAFN